MNQALNPTTSTSAAGTNVGVNNQQQLVQQMMQQNTLTEEKKAQITMLTDMG